MILKCHQSVVIKLKPKVEIYSQPICKYWIVTADFTEDQVELQVLILDEMEEGDPSVARLQRLKDVLLE